MKKAFSVLIIVLTIVFIPLYSAESKSIQSLNDLSSCKELYTYSGYNYAYFYGYTSNTLYSAQSIPDINLRYIKVDGLIRAVCHNETCAYALYESKATGRSYSIVRMNMQSGACDYFDIGAQNNIINSSFAVTDAEIFIIRTDSYNSYAASYDISGKRKYNYKFDFNIEKLFINNSKAYAVLSNGDIYAIENGMHTYCNNLGNNLNFANAGTGYVYTEGKLLISLTDNSRENIINAKASKVLKCKNKLFSFTGNTLKSSDGGKITIPDAYMLTATANLISVLSSNYECNTISISEMYENRNGNNEYDNNTNQSYQDFENQYKVKDNIILGIESGTTVSQFKKNFSEEITVYNKDGDASASGKIATGFQCKVYDNTYKIAVRGDVTGEGNVKSNDVDVIMKNIVGLYSLENEFYAAADYNFDGVLDNRDLVLIAQKCQSQ